MVVVQAIVLLVVGAVTVHRAPNIFLCLNRRWNKCRSVATDAAIMPIPGSMVDQIASLAMFLKKLPVGTVIASRYTMRITDAIEPLSQN